MGDVGPSGPSHYGVGAALRQVLFELGHVDVRRCPALDGAGKILSLFAHVRRHRLLDGDRHLKTFWDPITNAQRTVLELLDIPASQFGAET